MLTPVAFSIRVYFAETPYAYGPSGAKGIGELPMDGPAPAILNAVEHATGVAMNHVPLTPELLSASWDRSLAVAARIGSLTLANTHAECDSNRAATCRSTAM